MICSLRDILASVVAVCVFGLLSTAYAETVTVLTPDHTAELADALVADGDLWVLAADLAQINGFELKPEGACCGAVCIPLKRDPSAGFIREQDGRIYLNLSKLAHTLNEPVVAEPERRVFSFGEVPAVRGCQPRDCHGARLRIARSRGQDRAFVGLPRQKSVC